MSQAAYLQEQAEHCFRLARRPLKPETAQKWMELGQEYLAKARALEAEQWPGPEATEALMKLVTAAKADAASRRIAD